MADKVWNDETVYSFLFEEKDENGKTVQLADISNEQILEMFQGINHGNDAEQNFDNKKHEESYIMLVEVAKDRLKEMEGRDLSEISPEDLEKLAADAKSLGGMVDVENLLKKLDEKRAEIEKTAKTEENENVAEDLPQEKEDPKVIDLTRLDEGHNTAEIIKALESWNVDEEDKEFVQKVAWALKNKNPDTKKRRLQELQMAATDDNLSAISLVMEDKSFEVRYTKDPRPAKREKPKDPKSQGRTFQQTKAGRDSVYSAAVAALAAANGDISKLNLSGYGQGFQQQVREMAQKIVATREQEARERAERRSRLGNIAAERQAEMRSAGTRVAGGGIVPPAEKREDGIALDSETKDKKEGSARQKQEGTKEKSDEEYRIRSACSDYNEIMLDMYRMKYMLDEKIMTAEDEKAIRENPHAVLEIVDRYELSMSSSERQKMEETVATNIIINDSDLNNMVPKWLAKQYVALGNAAKNEQDGEKRDKILALRKRVESRIDTLTDMIVAGEHPDHDLWFVDPTNAADVYDGYEQMLDVRSASLQISEGATEDEKQAVERRKAAIDKAHAIGKREIDAYDKEYGISAVEEKDAGRISENFDAIQKQLNEAKLTPETLKLVSNFRFLDKDGNPEPQFEKDGKPVLEYVEGATIRPDSKLAKALLLSKQEIIKRRIGGERPTNEEVAQELNDMLPATLYVFHVNSPATLHLLYASKADEKDVKEKPDQYTNPKHKEHFLAALANVQRPMEVSDRAFNMSVDFLCNANAAYAARLDKKLGNKSTWVATKVLGNLAPIDKMAAARTDRGTKESKSRFRKTALKNMVLSASVAAVMSYSITLAGTAMAADATLTALTGGANKYAGMALGTILGVGFATASYIRWRKQQKEQGKPTSLKALVRDPNMMVTLATTALGAAALGCAVTGNPGLATKLGVVALSLGSGKAGVQTALQAHQAGYSIGASLAWGAGAAGATVMGGFLGRLGANATIDYANNHGSNIFKHQIEVENRIDDKVEITYKDGVVDRAQETLGKWYEGHGDLLQQRVDQINAYNAEHGTNINPYRYLLAAHDAGAIAPDNMLLHNQYGADVYSHGNHMVLGEGWSHQTGIGVNTVGALGASVTPNGVNITPASVAAFNQIDPHIGMYNQVGAVAGAPIQNDGVLSYNASLQNGVYTQDPNGNVYTTYANNDGVTQEIRTPQYEKGFEWVPNERFEGLDMMGVLGGIVPQKLRDRIGALKDKIVHKRKDGPTPPPPPGPTPPPPPPTPKQLMIDEYKIVYGIAPSTEVKEGEEKSTYQKYYDRVEKERLAEAPDMSMHDYLLQRRAELDEIMASTSAENAVPSSLGEEQHDATNESTYKSNYQRMIENGEEKGTDFRYMASGVRECRQSLQQSNLTPENYHETITLAHFKKYMKHFIVKDPVVSDGTRDISLNPKFKDKTDGAIVYDLNDYLVEGKPLAECNPKGGEKTTPIEEIRENRRKEQKREGR